MNNDHRTSAIGLFNFAHSYAASAVMLSKCPPVDTTHPEAPVDFLAFHAIELYLKSFLRAHGLTVKDTTGLGHKLELLREEANRYGLSFDDENRVVLLASQTMMDRRYIATGYTQRHPHDSLFEICRSLHEGVGDKLKSLGLAKRLPSVKSLS